ncbi:transglutaminase-like cysteine peptidase [Pseudohoeflea coraliihabitans]|uniref:Transglutaminase-like cysteine peptidase n=1 Tax=Pseudohoeflea coraliihabitans TaxID=2860393 RepID=A0ABS6WLM6_9HYPH|nr:transglutaminase-like cysteine peptidase [Pseudohoeflea sp. DP4N28-3]MBW3096861.1 transglutaminase-like cysteine peptidase [Pseudohoeflea sp. DP4N28-3]
MKPGRILISATLAAAAFLVAPMAQASVWLKTGGQTSRPYGHVQYCSKNRSDCRASARAKDLPAARLSTLRSVNTAVNRAIKPVSDIRQFGKREHWTANTKAGDCEDYALAKRRALLRRGFSASQLLLTMARRRGEPHTVLVVRTREGDFVLDNMRQDVLPVNRTGLAYLKMQSQDNAARWVRVTGKTSQAAAAR